MPIVSPQQGCAPVRWWGTDAFGGADDDDDDDDAARARRRPRSRFGGALYYFTPERSGALRGGESGRVHPRFSGDAGSAGAIVGAGRAIRRAGSSSRADTAPTAARRRRRSADPDRRARRRPLQVLTMMPPAVFAALLMAAAAGAGPGPRADGQSPLGTVCGMPLPAPARLPAPESPPIVLAVSLCFEQQGGSSLIDPQTYLYYIQVKPSEPSRNIWHLYTDETETGLKGDFQRLWSTRFLDDLTVEALDFPLSNGVLGKVIVFRMEERQRIKIVDYEGLTRIDAARSTSAARQGRRNPARLVPRRRTVEAHLVGGARLYAEKGISSPRSRRWSGRWTAARSWSTSPSWSSKAPGSRFATSSSSATRKCRTTR